MDFEICLELVEKQSSALASDFNYIIRLVNL